MAVRMFIVVAVVAGCTFRPGGSPGDGGPGFDVTFMDAPHAGDSAPVDWWDPTYLWRMRLTVLDVSASMLDVGFQVGVQYDLDAAPCTGPRDGIRIVHGTTELPRVIDEVGAVEWLWFPVETPIPGSGGSDIYWLYCANATPAPAPQAPVFDMLDDFNGNVLDLAVWAKQGAASVGNGSVTMDNSDDGIHTVATYGPGWAIDFVVQISSAADPDFWAGFQVGFPDNPPWNLWYSHRASQITPAFYSSTTGLAMQWEGVTETLDAAPHLYGVENYGVAAMYRYADVPVDTHLFDKDLTSTLFNARLYNGTGGSGVLKYDMARIRHAVSPAPTVTVGAPETY